MADTVARRRLRTAVRGLESAVQAVAMSVVLLPQENAEQALTAALRDTEARLREVQEQYMTLVSGDPTVVSYQNYLTEGAPPESRRPTPRPEVAE